MKSMVTILGPTASGKTPLAVALASRMDGEIISADSRQVYRRMDIGTGKDLSDYSAGVEGESVNHSASIPYHLIDICEPGTKYNLFQYQQDFWKVYADIVSRGKQPILCGGTGLYIEAVLKGYQLSPVPQNPVLRRELEGKSLEELTAMLKELKARNGSHMHNTTDVDTAQRAIRAIEIEMATLPQPLQTIPQPLPVREGSGYSQGQQSIYSPPLQGGVGGESGGVGGESSLVFGVSIPRELRREKITRRLKARLEEGMVDEVRGLLAEGIPAEDLIYYGLEYKYLTEYVIGRLSYDEMFRQLEIAIHQFAKRQMTWFRGMERRGFTIHWIDGTLPMEEKVNAILEIVNRAKNK